MARPRTGWGFAVFRVVGRLVAVALVEQEEIMQLLSAGPFAENVVNIKPEV